MPDSQCDCPPSGVKVTVHPQVSYRMADPQGDCPLRCHTECLTLKVTVHPQVSYRMPDSQGDCPPSGVIQNA